MLRVVSVIVVVSMLAEATENPEKHISLHCWRITEATADKTRRTAECK